MPDHIITVQVADGVLLADCSCGYGLTPSRLQRATLADLNDLADDHIQRFESPRSSVLMSDLLPGEEIMFSQQVLETVRAAYVHGLDNPGNDPRIGVFGDSS